MKFWTLYWLSGKKQFLSGDTIEAAFTKAGYSAGAVAALDFYSEGFNFDYVRAERANGYVWTKLPTPSRERMIQLDTMEVDGVKIVAINMQPLLNEAQSLGRKIEVCLPSGGGPGIGWEELFRDGFVYVPASQLPALWQTKLE